VSVIVTPETIDAGRTRRTCHHPPAR